MKTRLREGEEGMRTRDGARHRAWGWGLIWGQGSFQGRNEGTTPNRPHSLRQARAFSLEYFESIFVGMFSFGVFYWSPANKAGLSSGAGSRRVTKNTEMFSKTDHRPGFHSWATSEQSSYLVKFLLCFFPRIFCPIWSVHRAQQMLSPTLQHFRVTSSRAVLDRAHALLDMTQSISLTHTRSSAAWEGHRQNLRRGVNVAQLSACKHTRRAGPEPAGGTAAPGGAGGSCRAGHPVHKLFSKHGAGLTIAWGL